MRPLGSSQRPGKQAPWRALLGGPRPRKHAQPQPGPRARAAPPWPAPGPGPASCCHTTGCWAHWAPAWSLPNPGPRRGPLFPASCTSHAIGSKAVWQRQGRGGTAPPAPPYPQVRLRAHRRATRMSFTAGKHWPWGLPRRRPQVSATWTDGQAGGSGEGPEASVDTGGPGALSGAQSTRLARQTETHGAQARLPLRSAWLGPWAGAQP